MSTQIEIRRTASVPDATRVARFERAPELGPRILFFSGGSALRKVCRRLKLYTHNSIHLITPFDSGGSSAQLRNAFAMLSVGDLRNRLLSLADETVRGNPEIYALFSHRLPGDAGPAALTAELEAMVAGRHPLVARVPKPLRQIVRTQLRDFHAQMPVDFDLRRASIGNLLICGGYLSNDHDIDAVVFLFRKLVEVRGKVKPVVDANLHLCAELASGERLVGQHRLTGKETPPIESPVVDLSLVKALDDPQPASAQASEDVLTRIREAELICLPMGSFYSSILANLLPRGVGRAIAQARCPKLYIPNMAHDPEMIGMSLADSVARLLEAVRRDAGEDTPTERILNLVLLDSTNGSYEMGLDLSRVKEQGVEVADLPLVQTEGDWPLIDAQRLVEVLLSLV